VTTSIAVGDRLVGQGHPVFVIAELSANHGGDLGRAMELVHAAADAGADAVKLQTYTADTMTIRSNKAPFRIGGGTAWDGQLLYDLYLEASTPWEWFEPLQKAARGAGMVLFSTPFDASAIDFLEAAGTPAHKIASFELVDIPLIARAAATGKPLLLSTGMASAAEIDEAVTAARGAGDGGVLLFRCNSSYPAEPADMNLATIPAMAAAWQAPVGLSDHTMKPTAAVAAVALGAAAIEKHLTLRRSDGGPDSSFSLEPAEFRDTVSQIRDTEAALGSVRFGPTEREKASRALRRSLFVVEDVAVGDRLTERNVRAIRPGDGLAPKFLPAVLGRRAASNIEAGTPLSWDHLAGPTVGPSQSG
jgi:pseudaminic acid synthase